jgi:ABC-type lipopolysaccharide export system ATPase subunit
VRRDHQFVGRVRAAAIAIDERAHARLRDCARLSGVDVLECAARVGVAEHLDRPPALLADEPFRRIAPRGADDLITIFQRLARDGVAVVLTGHEVPTLLKAADHVSWCTSGTTYELGPPALATQHDAFRREYLGAWFR